MKKYLDYYRTRKEPHYAVLVTGDWGTGKTYQVVVMCRQLAGLG
ncbi:hypothetical protein [Mesorhizobium australicum]